MSDSVARVNDFFSVHQSLLNCYASIIPQEYKLMDAPMQKDFCFQERVRLEELLTKAKVSPKDFFIAQKHQWNWKYYGDDKLWIFSL